MVIVLERKTHFYIAIHIPDHSATSILHAIKQLVKKYGKNCFRSITSDRGKEFNCFREVEAMDIPFYFAAPIPPGREGPMRVAMDYSGSFTLKAHCFLM